MAEDDDRTPVSREGQSAISEKIRILRREGEDPKQAAAIAYSMWRRGRLGKKGGHKGGRRGKRVRRKGKRVTLRKGFRR